MPLNDEHRTQGRPKPFFYQLLIGWAGFVNQLEIIDDRDWACGNFFKKTGRERQAVASRYRGGGLEVNRKNDHLAGCEIKQDCACLLAGNKLPEVLQRTFDQRFD